MSKSLRLIAILASCLTFACANVSPRTGSEKVIVSEEAAPNCFKLDGRKYISPPISIFNKQKSKETLLVKIKNDAIMMKADNVFIASEEESNFKELSLKIEFYSCQNGSDISFEALGTGCENKNTNACYTLAKRNQKTSDYAAMFFNLNRSCKLNDKKACDWLIDFARQKDSLKKACESKEGPACLAAAKAADAEGNPADILGYLDQGCKLNHQESCFYLKFVREKRNASDGDDEDKDSKEYLTNLTEDSLKQQKVKSILAFLNAPLKD